MSFSMDVKEELINVFPNEMHCRKAELAALLSYYGIVEEEGNPKVFLCTDNQAALRKCFTLLNKTFNIKTNNFWEETINRKNYIVLTPENAEIDKVLKFLNINDPMPLIKKDCCKRAYLRGAFLAGGFVNDPEKAYHLELVSSDAEYTKLLTYLLSQFNIIPKCSLRKKYSVLYFKESEVISDVLNIMGAHKSLMEMVNAKIVKNVRNSVNRRNNCDMANITKAVTAASKQIEDILLIQNTVGLDALPDSLKEMAVVRMENPESSFSELGELLSPQVGKSGVNHRLRKLSEYAEDLRKKGRDDD